jgi:hypothetical protein
MTLAAHNERVWQHCETDVIQSQRALTSSQTTQQACLLTNMAYQRELLLHDTSD